MDQGGAGMTRAERDRLHCQWWPVTQSKLSWLNRDIVLALTIGFCAIGAGRVGWSASRWVVVGCDQLQRPSLELEKV